MLNIFNKDCNTIEVLHKIIKLNKIRVTKTAIKNYLFIHPNFPTLKSIQDALNHWDIDNQAKFLSLDEIKKIDTPFIVHRNIGAGRIALIKKIVEGRVYFYSGNQRTEIANYADFSKSLSGAILIVKKSQSSGEADYNTAKQFELLETCLILSAVTTIALISTLSPLIYLIKNSDILLWKDIIITILITIGAIASTLIIAHELKIRVPIIDKICHLNGVTDCNSVLNSKVSTLFAWINWGDIGLIYFASCSSYIILSLLVSDVETYTSGLFFIASISFCFSLFFISYQLAIVKKICPLCMIVQSVLLAKFALLLTEEGIFRLTFSGILRLILSFLLIGIIYLLIRLFQRTRDDLHQVRNSLGRLKSNPSVFIAYLQSQQKLSESPIPEGIRIGNPLSKVRITVFLSLYCHPCAKAFIQLYNLYMNNKDICINIFLTGNRKKTDLVVFKDISSISTVNDSERLRVINDWYNSLINSKNIGPLEQSHTNLEGGIAYFDYHKNVFKDFQIIATPAIFINRFLLGPNYQIQDIELFLEDIKQLNNN